jgi:hypothetical protein
MSYDIFSHAQKGHTLHVGVDRAKRDDVTIITTPEGVAFYNADEAKSVELAGKRALCVVMDELADVLKPAPTKPETFKDRQRKRPRPGWAVELGLGLGPRFKSRRFP